MVTVFYSKLSRVCVRVRIQVRIYRLALRKRHPSPPRVRESESSPRCRYSTAGRRAGRAFASFRSRNGSTEAESAETEMPLRPPPSPLVLEICSKGIYYLPFPTHTPAYSTYLTLPCLYPLRPPTTPLSPPRTRRLIKK